MKPSTLLALLATAALGACTVNTVPEPVSPSAAVKYLDLEVPADLEVRSADFTATTFADVSGGSGWTSSSVGGRAFIKIHAVHRTTGEQYLLLYEDVTRRRAPVQIIRFVPSPGVRLPEPSAGGPPDRERQ